MPPYLIALILFILGAGVFALLQRNNFVETLPLEANERILFEDDRSRFKSKSGTGRWQKYPWGFIRVTNQRIFLTQRGLLGKKHFVRFVIHYDDSSREGGPDSSPGAILKSGRQTLTTDRNHLQLDQEKDRTILRIFPKAEEVAWFQIAEIVVYPGRVEPYVESLIKGKEDVP